MLKQKFFAFALLLFTALPFSASHANVLGEMQTFSPNTDGFDFITVHSSRQPPKGYFTFSNFLNYAKNHLLVYPAIPANQDMMKYEDALLEYDFGFAYNFTDSVQFTFQAPALLQHWSDTQDGIKIDLTKGVHSYRPGLKYTLDSGPFPQWAVLASVDFPNVQDSPYTGIDPHVIPNLEGVFRWKWGSFYNAINVGGRYRDPSPRPANAFMYPLRSQVTASYGLSKQYSEYSRWVFEVFGSYPLDKDPYQDATDASSVDLLLGLKHRWFKNLNIDWGATVEPGVKTLSPDWRVFAGLVYYWQPLGPATSSEDTQTAAPTGFRVYPARTTVAPNEKVIFTTDPGQNIKNCRQLSGEGLLTMNCYFTAGSEEGTARIEFENDEGKKAYSIIETKYVASTSPLAILPENPRVSNGGTIQLRARGGKGPYKFKLQSGPGDMTPDGLYIAPLKPASAQALVTDSAGATATTAITVVAIAAADFTINLQNLTFVYNTADFTSEGERIFQENVAQLRKVRIKSVIVEGHTDSKGKDSYNLDLSRRRAATAKRELIKTLDLDPDQVEATGFGETAPIATNNTAAGRQLNRRVTLKVYYRK